DRSQVRRVAVVFRAARAESGAIRTAVRLLQEAAAALGTDAEPGIRSV
ncbi:hypothetical protein GB864_16050, partial [Agromyces sp. MMS17-SY077]|nr:hypothetical protein [Agromyces seonyuensis]